MAPSPKIRIHRPLGREAESGDRLRALLERAPLLSPAALRLVLLLGDPEQSMHQVVDVARTDGRLSLAVMKVAQSAFFSAGVEVRSLQQAIVRLGAVQVLAIALEVCSTPAGDAALQAQPGLAEGYWAHSLSAALAARQLARKLPGASTPEQAYTAGLLHDIGKPALALLTLQDRVPPPAEFRHGRSADCADEERRFGFDHARAGWEALRSWGLPVELGIAVLHHHRPQNAPLDVRPLATLLQLADRIAHRSMAGLGRDEPARPQATDTDLRGTGLDGLVQSVQREFLALGDAMLRAREAK